MKIIAEIPARGGSKGVPGKALKKIGAHPLIAYSIMDALAIKGITKVVVNTDAPAIRDVAIKYGAEVPFLRPAKFSGDDADLGHAIAYSRKWQETHEGFVPDIYIIMSPTNPFRRKNIINDALNKALADKSIFNIGSVIQAPASPDNFWLFIDGQLQKFNDACNKTNSCLFCESSLSFNIVMEFREGIIPDRHFPVFLDGIEAIDIDEPIDLCKAKAAIEQNLYPITESENIKTAKRKKGSFYILDKLFNEQPVSNTFKIIRHPDYPRITDAEIQTFTNYAQKQDKIVMTGCQSRVHPYRLKYTDQQGFSNFLYQIDHSIRGNRHCYPEVFSFIPALIAIPKGTDIQNISLEQIEMYQLPSKSLLDLAIPVERLLINHYFQKVTK